MYLIFHLHVILSNASTFKIFKKISNRFVSLLPGLFYKNCLPCLSEVTSEKKMNIVKPYTSLSHEHNDKKSLDRKKQRKADGKKRQCAHSYITYVLLNYIH